jgi:addiction module HigA family antidote
MTIGEFVLLGGMAKRMTSRLSTITKITTTRKTKRLDPIHPGEILREDFLKPFGISINQLARDLDVPPNRISMIVNGQRSVSADTALRLGTCFGMSPEIWLNLQSEYDIRVARRQHGEEIERRVRRHDAA